MKENKTTKIKELGKDMLEFLIRLYQDQEQLEITYEIKKI